MEPSLTKLPPHPTPRCARQIKPLRSSIYVYTERACAANKVYCTYLCKHTRSMVWTCVCVHARTRTHALRMLMNLLQFFWERSSRHCHLAPHPPFSTSSPLYPCFPFSFSAVLALTFRQSLQLLLRTLCYVYIYMYMYEYIYIYIYPKLPRETRVSSAFQSWSSLLHRFLLVALKHFSSSDTSFR